MLLLITLIDRTETNRIRTVALGEPEPNRTLEITEQNPNFNFKVQFPSLVGIGFHFV